MSLILKASAISNLTDARYFAARGVQYVGYQMDPKALNYIPGDRAKEMADWLDGTESIVEVGSYQDLNAILEYAEVLGTNILQIKSQNAVLKEFLGQPSFDIVLHLSLEENYLLPRFEDLKLFPYKFFLWESAQGIRIPEKKLTFLREKAPVLLEPQSFVGFEKELVTQGRIAGLSFRGGDELKVGYKSFEELDYVFDMLEDLIY